MRGEGKVEEVRVGVKGSEIRGRGMRELPENVELKTAYEFDVMRESKITKE